MRVGSLNEKYKYTDKDYRFLYNNCHLYAFNMRPNKSGKYLLKLAGNGNSDEFGYQILSVNVVGGSKVEYKQTPKGLVMQVVDKIDTSMPICFDINID